MIEHEYTAEPILTEACCTTEGCSGYFRPTGGRILLTSPPRIPHKCYVCGAEKNFTEKFPKVSYKRKERLI